LVTRINWDTYADLLDGSADNQTIASELGVSADAVRLARARRTDPRKGYVGLDVIFFDTESTSLTAIMGRILCASFADGWGNVTTLRIDQTNQRNVLDDRELVVAIRDYMENNGDVLCGWNSKLHDVPLLNARLLFHGERPLRSDIKHIDLMYYAGGQFAKIGSKKLINVQKFLPEIENAKTDIDWTIWQLAGAGDKPSLEYIVEHCEADILVLRDVFAKLKPYVRNIHR
jgi:uncharacterized protein YprB with RNaseH-like and TPR domain